MREEEIKKTVRENYARIAQAGNSCCCSAPAPGAASGRLGYSKEEIASAPKEADLGLGCGNPLALASLQPGEVVLDLGSGGGFDCFLASPRVGAQGRVIGVDMTPEMIERARAAAGRGGYGNVEFRLGELENLPVADGSVDVIISNCVINLVPDKARVFREAHRVLRPGGRLMVSDIVLTRPLPDLLQSSAQAYVACVAGASLREEYLALMRRAGFGQVEVQDERTFPLDLIVSDPAARGFVQSLEAGGVDVRRAVESVVSVKVSAVKAPASAP